MFADLSFREATASGRTESIPYSHLSIELARLGAPDVDRSERLEQLFMDISPWVETAYRSCAGSVFRGRARVSTCVLVDDYFARIGSPDQLIPRIRRAAEAANLKIDYLVRQSGLVEADAVSLPDVVLGRLVPDPPPGTNGSRPLPQESGWLPNGQRSPSTSTVADGDPAQSWQPPMQSGINRHSIFADVELWSGPADGRIWSPSFLAAIWQLLRLGLLRHHGKVVAMPGEADELPADWAALPPVLRLNRRAMPFTAYRTLSVLGLGFLPMHDAARTILDQIVLDPEVLQQISTRAAAESYRLDSAVNERTGYVFVGP